MAGAGWFRGDVRDLVRVTFSAAYHDGDQVYAGTFHADPAYGGRQNDPHDVAVVVLDKAVKGIAPVQLPRAGSLDLLTANAPVTGVGYGAYAVPNGPGGHRYLYNDVRMAANGTLNSETKSWLRISENPSAGNGGRCFGDSGGPNFLAGTNIEAATTITGDAICRSTNTAYSAGHPVGPRIPPDLRHAALTRARAECSEGLGLPVSVEPLGVRGPLYTPRSRGTARDGRGGGPTTAGVPGQTDRTAERA